MTSQFTAAEQERAHRFGFSLDPLDPNLVDHHEPLAEGPVVATSSKPDLTAATRGVPFPRTPADLDLEQLTEITARDGFAVFDPAAPGGFRELNPAERELLEQERTREVEPHPTEGPIAAHVDVVERRTADPAFPYLPGAAWSDAGYREPRSDAEAAARVAYLDAQYQREMESDHKLAVDTEHWHPQPTEVEQALIDAAIDEHYSALAHDGDTEPTRRRRDLEALDRLRPRPELEPELAAELDEQDHDPHHDLEDERDHGPDVRGEDPGAAAGLALEDAWFRSSLHDVVPTDAPDRDAVIDRAVACARERFVEHGEITYPEHALALTSTDQPEPEQPETDQELDQELDEPAPEPDEEPEL